MGKLAGIAHDAEREELPWQEYLKRKKRLLRRGSTSGRKTRKNAPAIYGGCARWKKLTVQIDRVISYCCAGHHSGLQDWSTANGAGKIVP